MFGLFGRVISSAYKPRVVSSASALSALPALSASHSHPPLLSSRLTPPILVTLSTPILSNTSSLHSLALTGNRTTESFSPSPLQLSSSLLAAGSTSLLGSGSTSLLGTGLRRHQTTDFTVRDSFEVAQSKADWTDLERCHRASPKPRRFLSQCEWGVSLPQNTFTCSCTMNKQFNFFSF